MKISITSTHASIRSNSVLTDALDAWQHIENTHPEIGSSYLPTLGTDPAFDVCTLSVTTQNSDGTGRVDWTLSYAPEQEPDLIRAIEDAMHDAEVGRAAREADLQRDEDTRDYEPDDANDARGAK